MVATSGVAKVNVNDTVFLQRQMSWWVINFFCAAMDTWCRVCPCFKAKALHSMRMVMTWRHCCNWAVGDVFTTMSVTDPAMPKAA